MALFIRQSEERSKLQERLAAELQEKAKQRAQAKDAKAPDGVEDAEFMKGTKQTSSLAWAWVLALVLVVVLVVSLAL